MMFKIVLSLLLGTTSWAAKHSFSEGEVSFIAKGKPSLIKIEGKGSGLNGELQDTSNGLNGQLSFDLSGLDTGIKLRDQHMKENYLETNKFPKAVLHLKDLKVENEEGKPFGFSGEMEIKGVKKAVKGEATVKRSGDKAEVTATFPILLNDYPIGVPSYLGVTVAEQVQVNVKGTAVRK